MLTPPREFVWRRRLPPAPLTAEDSHILMRFAGLHGPNYCAGLTVISVQQDWRDAHLMLSAALARLRYGRDCSLGRFTLHGVPFDIGGALEPCALLEELERFI